jgi:cytohesin
MGLIYSCPALLAILLAFAQDEADAKVKQLFQAIREGKIGTVRKLIDEGVSLRSAPGDHSVLHQAAEYSQVEIARLLIEKGADVKATESLDGTPLNIAAYRGPVEMVRLLIDAGADLHSIRSRENATPLHSAASCGNVEIVQALIKAGAKVNFGNFTPLTEAAKYGHPKVVDALLAAGADPHAGDSPALHWARNLSTTRALLKGGAKVEAKDRKGRIVLHLTSAPFWGPREDSLEVLIESGADVNARDQEDSTPLHEAARHGFPEIVRLFLKAGAKANAVDKHGNTPLSLAKTARANDAKLAVKLLEEAGADEGLTPLHKAAKAGDVESVRKLIASGAKLGELGPSRMTALHLASRAGADQVCVELLKAGADPKARAEQEMTPLHLAANSKAAAALLDGGALIDPDPEPKRLGEAGIPSPLFVAATEGRQNVAILLMERKARLPEGLVCWITFFGRSSVLKIVLDRGVDPNQPLHSKWSRDFLPIHVAAAGGLGDTACPKDVTPKIRLEMARLLIKAGAKVGAGAQSGYFFDYTPLHGAALRGEPDIIRLLVEAKAPVNAVGSGGLFDGVTPLHCAAKAGHAEAVSALLKAGADPKAKTGPNAHDPNKTPIDLAKTDEVRNLLQDAMK